MAMPTFRESVDAVRALIGDQSVGFVCLGVAPTSPDVRATHDADLIIDLCKGTDIMQARALELGLLETFLEEPKCDRDATSVPWARTNPHGTFTVYAAIWWRRYRPRSAAHFDPPASVDGPRLGS